MSVSIKTAFDAGRKAFENFIRAIQELDKERPEELSISSWEDELGRLRMWAGNIGAHQSGQSSSDFRLRDSSHIRQQIVNLLDQIPQRLQDTLMAITVGEAEDIESLNENDSEGDAPVSETQSLQESLATIIDCLFEMSILVRKPAQRDHRMNSNKAEVDFYEHYDCSYIRDKFPNADQRIVARLGQAITRRRMYLKYRERHAMKLRQGINAGNAIPVGSDILSETVATNFQIIGDSFDDQASEAGLSGTSYAPTLVSGGHITIPAPPRNSQGGAPFEYSSEKRNQHVARHLQEVALFVVPRDEVESDNHDFHDGFGLDVNVAAEKKTLDPSEERKEKDAVIARCKERYEQAIADAAAEAATPSSPSPPSEKKKEPIKFKDAVGRNFRFPFHLCNTWMGMENLIREAFLHVDVIGPRVADGHYDLIGPQGDIILPQEWESVVEPGWMITMHMWPIPEPAPSEAPPFEEDDESVVVPDASSAHAGVSLSPPEASSDPSAPFGEAAVSGGGKPKKAKQAKPSAYSAWLAGKPKLPKKP